MDVGARLNGDDRAISGFGRFAGLCAIGAGIFGIVELYGFVVADSLALFGLGLLLASLMALPVIVWLYRLIQPAGSSLALLVLLLVASGVLGAVIHGGDDLADALGPVGSAGTSGPNAVDPRGLLTFGLTGLGFMSLAVLVFRRGILPAGLVYMAFVLGVVLIVIYLGRILVFDATSPLVRVPATLAGVGLPALYISLGLVFLRHRPISQGPQP
jgi:hypothetical protein